MNVMAELSEAWSSPGKTNWSEPWELATNPLPYFEEAFQHVQNLIVGTYQARHCTFAELLEDARKADPGIVEKYFELLDAVDCDVYGKWCSGTLTVEEYELFCATVDEWKAVTMRMVKAIDTKSE